MALNISEKQALEIAWQGRVYDAALAKKISASDDAAIAFIKQTIAERIPDLAKKAGEMAIMKNAVVGK